MSGLLPKKFPGKMAEPFLPFAIAGLVVLYGINAGAGAMMNSEEYKNDPRNPYRTDAVTPKPEAHAEGKDHKR